MYYNTTTNIRQPDSLFACLPVYIRVVVNFPTTQSPCQPAIFSRFASGSASVLPVRQSATMSEGQLVSSRFAITFTVCQRQMLAGLLASRFAKGLLAGKPFRFSASQFIVKWLLICQKLIQLASQPLLFQFVNPSASLLPVIKLRFRFASERVLPFARQPDSLFAS